jgi:hypothetical protein
MSLPVKSISLGRALTLSTGNYVQNEVTIAQAEHRLIEFSSNRALAYGILAAEAPNAYVMFYRLLRALAELEKFIPSLTPDYLESLAESQQRRLCLRMQDAHRILTRLLRSSEAASIVRFPLLGTLVSRLRERIEDLDDVLEGMFLAGD